MMNHKIEWLVIYLFSMCVCFFLVKIQKVRQAKLNLYGEYEKKKKKSRNFIFNYFFCYLFQLN